MEESLRYLKEQFGLEDVDVRSYSPLALAYIGDGIYELFIRTMILSEGNRPVHRMHREASRLVRAGQQSAMMEVILPVLTDEEKEIYRRGRNAKPHTPAKNASLAEYRRATGFEAVMGWLYLNGQMNRIVDLMKVGLEATAEPE